MTNPTHPDADLLAVADAYKAKARFPSGANPETATSSRVFNSGSKLTLMREGASVTSRRKRDAMNWFSEHWPDGAEWPSWVPRPEVAAT